MTTISNMISNAKASVSEATASVKQGGSAGGGSRTNDGYDSFGGSVVRNTLVGAATGAVIGLPTGIGAPIGAGVGAAVGAGSALIRHPRVASSVGDGMKAAMSGAAGGALVGTVTPFGPVGGAVAGGVGGFLTGVTSSMLEGVGGGKFSIEGQKTVLGRVKQGLLLGAASGAAVGGGAGLLFGGIGAVPGAIWGAVIGGVGGAFHGLTTGTVDAATGAKDTSFLGGGAGDKLPHLGGDDKPSQGGAPHQGGGTDKPGQVTQHSPVQEDCEKAA